GAAVVIPYLGNGQILLIKQFRYPVRQIMLELPAGKIDAGENPDQTIRRELAEETHPEMGVMSHSVNASSLILFQIS
ncbi:MAG: NUDIX hydrolase, partial [Candidatus Marinimicrobia bacterium]|nr:NUDIX hydrolase [Candidatus Neomarinimicrobiota bacterium]